MTTPAAPPRVGCVFRPQLAPERLAASARAADAAGLDELWLWEDCFAHGGISTAAIALSHSDTLSVGVGVLPAPMRNVALTAMELATLERAFPGRVRIGVGHGVQDWMGRIGARVSSPMTYLREYLTCLTALLRGETVTYSGRYVQLADVRLEWPPNPNVELLAAATGPRTLALSGELSSGTILTSGTTPDELREALGHINSGRQEAGRTGAHSVIVNIVAATGADARADAMCELEFWQVDPTKDVAAFGGAQDIARAAHRWLAAGADTVVLQPAADVDISSFVTFVGSEVAPLLKDPGVKV
jgi:alkanesulfonate monooxygenase SsuD/methylene tetrahydromethanopterin reductase-like flavin-dependent oxidoreductase (luciferase family)